MSNQDYWIKEAVKKKGSYRASVARRYGARGFTQTGRIKQSAINKDLQSTNPKLRKRAQLAKTLKKLQHRQ